MRLLDLETIQRDNCPNGLVDRTRHLRSCNRLFASG
jgi:hypothetical protein